uniref:Cytosolic fatty-acid binding proteins domain-containing protein n=1 Tax=Globodera rostochiensis TaxID=31243 RepID=A0A914HZK7_GLORO
MASEKEIPNKFLGKFVLEKNEKFDEYLASKGVSWILRKLICYTSVTKTFEKSPIGQCKYNAYNQSSKQNTNWQEWNIGETFDGLGLDGKQHKITFGLEDNGNTLTEQHLRLENPKDTGEVYRYSVDDNDNLVLTLSNEGITARRFFKRVK